MWRGPIKWNFLFSIQDDTRAIYPSMVSNYGWFVKFLFTSRPICGVSSLVFCKVGVFVIFSKSAIKRNQISIRPNSLYTKNISLRTIV